MIFWRCHPWQGSRSGSALGFFEVSLIKVIEETSSVEVLWDRGVKREFKWSSVVFGSTDGPVQQKPSEIAVEPERPVQCALPVSTFSSVAAATSQQPPRPNDPGSLPTVSANSTVVTTGTTVNQQYSGTTPYMYPLRTGPFDYWGYASQYSSQANQTQYPYTYNGYYPTQMTGIAQHYNPYTYTQSYSQNQNRNGQLNWQQPYQGPSMAQEGMSMAQGAGTIHRFRLAPSQSPSGMATPAQPSTQPSNHLPSTSVEQSAVDATSKSPNTEKLLAAEQGSLEQASAHKDLSVLSSLQPSQIAEILCNNPEIQGIVWAAVDQAMAQAREQV